MISKQTEFLGVKLGGGESCAQESAYVLSLIPYEQTTTYKKGTALAPERVIDASQHIELFDSDLKIDASTGGICTLRPEVTDLQSITRHAAETRNLNPQALPGFIGGEHSITPAIIEGLTDEEIGIIWIDAHADLRKKYCGRFDNHACAARNSLRFGKIVQVGIRSLAEEEFTFLQNSTEVRRFQRWSPQAEEAVMSLPRNVYLSVDADGITPELVRAVGTPEPGGLGWEEILDILDFIFRAKKLLGFDVVELCPQAGDVASEFTIARLVYKIISYHALNK